MFQHIYNVIYSKTFHIYDILYLSLFNKNKDEIITESEEYICPDYIADETTIRHNSICMYENENNKIHINKYESYTSCVDFILFFIVINLCFILLSLIIENSFIMVQRIIDKYLNINNIKNINFKYLSNNIKKENDSNKNETQNNIDTNLKDKDDIEEFFYNYSEIIKIQQYLNKDDNLDKVLYFYKESSNFLQQTLEIINDKYRNIFIDKELFLKYYKDDSNNEDKTYLKFINMKNNKDIYTSCKDKISVNLNKLYEIEKIFIDDSLFNIYNTKKYFPLKKGQLCYLTNLSKLNVIIWLIKIGVYDYLIKTC